jgi:UDP-N-acetylglucosamine 4,6-dehydratase
MAQQFSDECLRFFIGDIRDRDRLRRAFNDVDMVIHAAALKHVNQAEYDCTEYIKTNVYGTENVIDAAIDCEVEKVLLISTDKAVNPISLYGASKLVSEKLFVAANNMVGKRKTRFSVVRLGNIWGSRGSVIPYYKKLVENGAECLPVTNPSMTRFFMTSENAAVNVIDFLDLMQGGETYIPRMGSIVINSIVDAFGKRPEIIGLRPGEKLHETACQAELLNLTLDFGDHFLIKPTVKLVHAYDYTWNGIGVPTKEPYISSDNWLYTVDEIKQLIKEA